MLLLLHISSLILLFATSAISLELNRVFIVFRHGHRNPLSLYPAHPKYNTTRAQYFGMLTPIGERQAIRLGERLRMYYKTVMGLDDIQPDMVRARSSETSRTLLTGRRFMEGFLSMTQTDIPKIPGNQDYVIAQFGPCKEYEMDFLQIMNKTPVKYRALLYLTRDKLERLEKLSGAPLANLRGVAHLYDTIMCEQMAENDLPDWAEEVYPEGLKHLAPVLLKLFTHTPYMLKQKSGPLINDIRKFMTEENPYNSIKFNIYSGHDSTLISLTRALELDKQLPKVFNFTAAIAFELHTGVDQEEQVKVRFFDLDQQEYEVVPGHCQGRFVCARQDFINVTKELAVDDVDRFCNNPLNATHSQEFLKVLTSQYVDTSSWKDHFPHSFADLGLSVLSHLPDFVIEALKDVLSQ